MSLVDLEIKAIFTILAFWKLVKVINFHQALFAGSQAYALKNFKIYVGGCGDTQAVAAAFG